MLRTVICELLNIEYPIIQGGMAHISTWELVSAVSNAGGLGIIGAGFYEPAWLKQQICLTRENTNRPFGVNVQVASPYVNQIIELLCEEKPPVVTTGGGNPVSYIPALKQAGIKVMPVVNQASGAGKMESAGVDAVIAEGTESGGHVGETTTMVLVPDTVDTVNIPVIAAGGIRDGRGMAAALSLGAAGVQMGTRFVCSTECTAHDNFKQQILRSKEPATVVTRQILGHPQRSLVNNSSDTFTELLKAGISKEELTMYDRGRIHLGLVEGDTEEGILLAGQTAASITGIMSVRSIIEGIIQEAGEIITGLNKLTTED